VDIVAAQTMEEDFETGIHLHSTSGLVFNVVPVIHRLCFQIKHTWLIHPEFLESFQNLTLHIEYFPFYDGNLADLGNLSAPLVMKILFGYFNDLDQMNMMYEHHYCDAHPGNILVKLSPDKTDVHFFWSDPGKTNSTLDRGRSKVKSQLNPQFLNSVSFLFGYLLKISTGMSEAESIVKRVNSMHQNLSQSAIMNSNLYLDSMMKLIQEEIEGSLNPQYLRILMRSLHPSSKFSEIVSSKRIGALERQNVAQAAINSKQGVKILELEKTIVAQAAINNEQAVKILELEKTIVTLEGQSVAQAAINNEQAVKILELEKTIVTQSVKILELEKILTKLAEMFKLFEAKPEPSTRRHHDL
jgi:hypothetical protein